MAKSIEIEIQVQIEKIKPLEDFLKVNAKFKGEDHQIDEYFTPVHRDFIKKRPAKEWLRLRNNNGRCSINYKNWHYDENGKSHHCDEYETKIDDAIKIKNIFDAINFKNIVTVDKKRKSYIYKKYEISIDKVKDLGTFVEIEYKGQTDKKPKEVTQEMVDFLKTLKLGKMYINFLGYPFMILFPKEFKSEKL